ncbi:MAG TPA: hypothetical protein VJ783_10925 [Pirellulales bacterium]|nr:hypothetical protein [Pirellulales bacterium]
MTITVTLPLEVAGPLAAKALSSGLTLEAYLTTLAERDVSTGNGAAIPHNLSTDEAERLLDELTTGPVLPHLPADFSRADIYADHN